jgi:hypothetical protein
MSTTLKEWLLKTIAELEEERDAVPGAVNEDAAKALAAMKLALASLEAEPVGFVARHKETVKFGSYLHPKADWFKNDDYEVLSAYTAPPAPVSVPAELTREEYKRRFMEEDEFDDTFRGGWNACRAAMLQGAEPVTTAYKLPEPIKDNRLNSGVEADDYYSGYQAGWNELLEAVSGNSPVIPEGWALVPVDMTPEQMRAVQIKSEIGSYAAANLSGAYALFREFWDVAVAAAPQQEV